VWLDPKKTTPYKFYQYWLNASDEDAAGFIKIFTQKNKSEIEALVADHAQAPHLRKLQNELAKNITARVHSQAEAEMAIKASSILFGNSVTDDLLRLNSNTFLSVFEGVPQIIISASTYRGCLTVTDLLSEATQGKIFSSKGEARKMIAGGGVSINKEKVDDGTKKPSYDLLQHRYLLVQKGKKSYFLIEITD
jgi:tyrosyl-tRNA synthetase